MADEDIARNLSLVSLNKSQTAASGDTQPKKSKRGRRNYKRVVSPQVWNEEKGNAPSPSQSNKDSTTGKKGSKNIQPGIQVFMPSTERADKDKKLSAAGNGITPIYVLQLLSTSQKDRVLGVFLSATDANHHALNYVHVWLGIMDHEIADGRGMFVNEKNSEAKMRKRMWAATGTIEILSASGVPTVRVLKKSLHGEGFHKGDTIYLSMDSSFVLGAYKSKDGEAWEACKKYWADLSVAASMEGLRHWNDERGDPRGKATIAGQSHQWYLKRYLLL